MTTMWKDMGYKLRLVVSRCETLSLYCMLHQPNILQINFSWASSICFKINIGLFLETTSLNLFVLI